MSQPDDLLRDVENVRSSLSAAQLSFTELLRSVRRSYALNQNLDLTDDSVAQGYAEAIVGTRSIQQTLDEAVLGGRNVSHWNREGS